MEDEKKKDKALLVGFYAHGSDRPSCNEHLDELQLLLKTYGIEDVERVPCFLKKVTAATYMGSGKLEELVEYVEANEYDLVVIDAEISPAQQRNLEKAFKCPVMERSEVIIGVFAQRAQSKEAQLQIELAKARYQLPRLKHLWTHLSRQRGGSSNTKGEGETQLEIDKRLLNKQIRKLERELKDVGKQRSTQRARRLRSAIPTFAVIGYTNAGKSTLLKALTGADVLVEDKLFATLDTSTKQFTLPNNQDILLIDTVGFIRKLPHTLVAAFKSTLEESLYTDILLHVVDASSRMALEQSETTMAVLKELKADKKPIITVFNKVDKCKNSALLDRLRLMHPHSVQISALKKEGFDDLFAMMLEFLSGTTKTVRLKIPQSEFKYFSEILETGKILEQEYEGNDIILTADCPLSLASKLARFQCK